MSKGPLIPNFLWAWGVGFLHLKVHFQWGDLFALKSTLFVGVGCKEAPHHLMSKGPLIPNFLWAWGVGFLNLKYIFCGHYLFALKSALFVGVGH